MMMPHSGQLVRHPEQSVVIAAEAVDHQDGPGLRRHLDRFVGPVGHRAAVELDVGRPGSGPRVPG